MINIRGAANQIIQPINPNIQAVLKESVGYKTDVRTGKRFPSYRQKDVTIQRQPLSGKEVMLIDGLEWQGGSFMAVHMYGNYEGLNRQAGTGADVLIFPQYNGADSREWLIIQVMESWPTWCRLLVCRQDSTSQKTTSTQI
jgi:hypothetical protein